MIGKSRTSRTEKQTAQAIAKKIVSDPEYVKKLTAELNAGRLSPQLEAMLWAYAWGKPVETTKHEGEIHHNVRVVHHYHDKP